MTIPIPSYRRVLVSGASVSGLTVSYWLARYGFNVTIVERASHLRPGGQALDVRGPALTVAERMGVLTTLRENATKLTGFSMVDADGNEIHRSEDRTLTGGRFDSDDVEIMRDDLCRVLFEAVSHVEYLFDDSITSLTQEVSGVEVTFERAAPRRFDLVVGADGLHSRVRRLAFGPEEQFLRRLGNSYVAVFGMPNFLGLERWEVMFQDDRADIGAMVMALSKNANARAYVGFTAKEPIVYDHRDIDAQKRLMADRLSDGGWVLPQLREHMMAAPDFHFDSISQIRMDGWSRGRVVLVGDAGYSVALASGQGTSVAMVGAYVLAGELATHKEDLARGIASYENELRDYVDRNQQIAHEQHAKNASVQAPESEAPANEGEPMVADSLPDFGALTLSFKFKNYEDAERQP
jgi:2-polyprenyl-6-methoxyphenol hydroxylase-like FAD-dependent oxidoreductase